MRLIAIRRIGWAIASPSTELTSLRENAVLCGAVRVRVILSRCGIIMLDAISNIHTFSVIASGSDEQKVWKHPAIARSWSGSGRALGKATGRQAENQAPNQSAKWDGCHDDGLIR